MTATVQAGVITADLQRAVEAVGLFYPPDPASLYQSSIGGNVATNAGGPRCLKYGVTRDYVLGLTAVLADGRGAADWRQGASKNVTGYQLTQLFVGSEGTLRHHHRGAAAPAAEGGRRAAPAWRSSRRWRRPARR